MWTKDQNIGFYGWLNENSRTYNFALGDLLEYW